MSSASPISHPRTLQTAAILALIALIAHAACLWAGWIWDDDSYVTANPVLLSPSGFVDVFTPGNTPQYYPLVFAGFWIEHALVGVDPLAYHAVNLLMHAANAVLLFVVLTRLNIRNAFWIAAIFAAHPMAVESVAWVTERKNVQSMLFALASFAMYLRFIDAPKGRVLGTWLASFLLFACALLSKTTAIFVPPCIVLALLWLQKPINTRLVLSVLPYFAIGLASGLFTAHVERTIVGATGSEFGFTLLERLQLAGRTAAFYISRFTLPTEQIFIYPRFTIDVRSIVDWLPFLGGVAVLVWASLQWKKRRAPLLITLWYGAALFPALGFFDVWPFRYSFVADHFAYAAMPVLALLVVTVLTSDLRGFENQPRAIALTALVAVLIPLSWRATAKYENESTLWLDTAQRNPEAWIAHNNLASIELRRAGEAIARSDTDAARVHATNALERARRAGELKPDEASNAANRSEALRLLGDLEQALVEIDRAIALQPKYGEFRWSRARILEMLGRIDDARSELETCVSITAGTRDEAQARRDLMRLALARGDNSDALLQCRAIAALEPRNADMIANLGSLLVAAGDQEQGRRELLRALQLRSMFSSDQALLRAAIAYLRLAIPIKLDARELAEAAATVETLRTFAPNDPGTRFFDLAVQLNAGDESARAKIEAMEREARAVGESAATAFADELAAFLAKRPAGAQ